MSIETLEVEGFANSMMSSTAAGFSADRDIPAMTTPTVTLTPGAAEYVIAGSTICLIC